MSHADFGAMERIHCINNNIRERPYSLYQSIPRVIIQRRRYHGTRGSLILDIALYLCVLDKAQRISMVTRMASTEMNITGRKIVSSRYYHASRGTELLGTGYSPSAHTLAPAVRNEDTLLIYHQGL